jgi:protein-L-isoaspartate(D-aspartate) O-methyltransferase
MHYLDDEDMSESSRTNAAMVKELERSCALRSSECKAAFAAVDRGHFWVEGSGSPELIYADTPLRTGRLHLSAPHIYAKALESLMPLRPGMSFLNVGSGTGYFNSIVAELTGNMATNHGIDIWPETVAHAKERCRLRGRQSIEFNLGNVYQLDVNYTMRYDRIYLGACANSRSKYLYRLLEVGGILIGPFQAGHTQQLRRVIRASETRFNVEVLGSVQFANLVEPDPLAPPSTPNGVSSRHSFSSTGSRRGSAASVDEAEQRIGSSMVGLPHVPFTFELVEQPWTPERCWVYPASYKQVVRMSVRCRPRNHTIVCLPTELWIKHIFPWCPRWWFEQTRPSTPTLCPISSPHVSFTASPTLSSQDAAPTDISHFPTQKRFSPLPRSYQAKRPEDDEEERSDDGASTRSPSSWHPSSSSSGFSSAQSTPEAGPSTSPAGVEVSEFGSIREEDSPPIDPEDVLFEVFSNGRRHSIGAEDDPDDAEPEDARRFVNPMNMLQLLERATHHRRWQPMREEPTHPGVGYPADEDEQQDEETEDESDEDDDDEYGSLDDSEDMTMDHVPMQEEEEAEDLDEELLQDAMDVDMMEDIDAADVLR